MRRLKQGAHGSVMVKALCYKPKDGGFENFFNLPNLSGRTRPRAYSASNRNEYQKQKNVLGSRARPVRRADNLTAICELIV
jgi:hypothetical protein